VQNKNKTVFKNKIYKFNRFSAKLLVDLLIISFAFKVLILGALFFIPKHSVSAEFSSINAQTLIQLTNSERQKHNLPILTPNQLLTKAAFNKAEDMLQKDYFAHTTPEGKPFYLWIQEADYTYRSAGENLAIFFDENQNIVQAWMKSPTHRQNILDHQYQEIGIAALTGKFNQEQTTTIVVQIFGEPLKSLTKTNNQGYTLGTNTEEQTILSDNSLVYQLTRINNFLNIVLTTITLIFCLGLVERLLYQRASCHFQRNIYPYYFQNRWRHVS